MFACTVTFRINNAANADEAAELWDDFGCEGDLDEDGAVREAGPASAPQPDGFGSFQVEQRFLIDAASAEEAEVVYLRCRPEVQHPVTESWVSEFFSA